MNKLIIAPSSRNNLDYLLNCNINAILIGVENFCITPMFRMSIDDIIDLANNSSKEIIVSINKMMHNNDLRVLEDILIKINDSNISKVMFYDLGVLNIANRIKFNKDLIISLEHLNTSINTNNFYYNNGVNYSLISSDITGSEINEISSNSKINLIVSVYGYLPIFYSRRYLVSNYLDYINKSKDDEIYYLKHEDDYYMIKEEKFGTVIYTNDVINLINVYQELDNISYFLIDGSYIDDNEFNEVIDSFINDKKQDNVNTYFFDRKTSYRVKKDE